MEPCRWLNEGGEGGERGHLDAHTDRESPAAAEPSRHTLGKISDMSLPTVVRRPARCREGRGAREGGSNRGGGVKAGRRTMQPSPQHTAPPGKFRLRFRRAESPCAMLCSRDQTAQAQERVSGRGGESRFLCLREQVPLPVATGRSMPGCCCCAVCSLCRLAGRRSLQIPPQARASRAGLPATASRLPHSRAVCPACMRSPLCPPLFCRPSQKRRWRRQQRRLQQPRCTRPARRQPPPCAR